MGSVKQSTKDVWALRNQGLGRKQISEKLGMSVTTVESAIRRGREQGKVKRVAPIRDRFYGTRVKRGTVNHVVDGLSDVQHEWIMEEVRRTGCETVAEYLLEIVRDLHEEVVQDAA